jgi:hypothetical protein
MSGCFKMGVLLTFVKEIKLKKIAIIPKADDRTK